LAILHECGRNLTAEIALACSNPPEGRDRWTLELLPQRMMDDEQVVEISSETVRLTLKNKLEPWFVKSWRIAHLTPEFLAAMERILDVYARLYENARPLVCFDEKPIVLHSEVRAPLATKLGKPKRVDYEYKRHGSCNLFLFLEPKAGKRYTLVTPHRTKQDWAYAMRYLADELYPTALKIDVVLDNLNTHTAEGLIEIFGKAEAERILAHLEFHYTPLHGSWLNMAEIELSVIARQCLRRRIADKFTLATEWIAWECPRNEACVTIRWKFTKQDARRVFAKYYPDPQFHNVGALGWAPAV